MERLSQNSFPLQLVRPGDVLPFSVPDNVSIALSGLSLDELQSSGLLFMVDHSYQARYPKTTLNPPRYGAACTAYFFIHPSSGDFLPLQTNVGANLLYTPLDSPTDWLLGKMIFNVNDMFHAQMFHLTVTHDVSEGVHLAALRTLSEHHPVMLLLEQMMLQGYSSRVVGEELCFNPGGHWDQLFYINNVGCRQFVTENWPSRGAFQGAYLTNDLQRRGLIDSQGRYNFKSFPFYDDARIIHQAQQDFFTTVVNSYYFSEADVEADYELQSWFKEVSLGALVFDFPHQASRATLVDVLTHFAYIVSVVHHSLNGGDPVGSKATLPFHLNALYAPLPTTKGVTDLLPFMPPPAEAVHYIGFLASFNRPFYVTTNRTLEDAFRNTTLLQRFNPETQEAGQSFFQSMLQLSSQILERTFNTEGLSTGMPFVYRALNPGYIPFFSAV
jgi:hypothetical protein